jgi:hypothetical protein
MLSSTKVNNFTSIMIYMGTFLISVLSFFTTYKGLLIILSWELALVGSLGLQIAMLGIAWNLIKIRENRSSYVIAFSVAAIFSIFFSYANFDTNLKANTRPRETRNAYFETAKPVLSQYSNIARKAALNARYQVDRLADLIEMEKEKGWATIVDEGSRDKFLQSIIDGARITVESWRKSTGTDYRQGKGIGIIVNYLESQFKQAESNLYRINEYIKKIDTLSLNLNPEMSVDEQYSIVNKAYISFPTSVVDNIVADNNYSEIPEPPVITAYAEKPANTQQALMMVIGDLYAMDSLTFLSLALAFAIDFIVILIAFAGSHIMAKSDYIMDKIEDDAMKRLRDITLDDVEKFNQILEGNLQVYRKATEYGKDISKLAEEYQHLKEKPKYKANAGVMESRQSASTSRPIIIKKRSRLERWLKPAGKR